MDVDDLGNAFTAGFSEDGGKYNTLSRTAALSRQLSMFFKRYINILLMQSSRNITVIYSGGDDMFLLGAWDDIIDASIEIYNKFRHYTQNKLGISAGIGLYPGKYPVHVMARETGALEDHSKGEREDGSIKNAVTLFAKDLRFGWDELENQVINEKKQHFQAISIKPKKKGTRFYTGCLIIYKALRMKKKTSWQK